jgi:hypothetical protein
MFAEAGPLGAHAIPPLHAARSRAQRPLAFRAISRLAHLGSGRLGSRTTVSTTWRAASMKCHLQTEAGRVGLPRVSSEGFATCAGRPDGTPLRLPRFTMVTVPA